MLKTANNGPMHYGMWMKKSYDRILPNQPRCYQFNSKRPNSQKVIQPAPCAKPLTLVCKSKCPRAGSPISPPPLGIQEQKSVTEALMRIRKGMIIPPDRLNKTLHQEEVLSLPELNIEEPGYQEKTGHLFGNITHNKQDILAYDCSQPLDIEPVQVADSSNICSLEAEPKEQRNATYRLLQKSCLLYTSPSPRDKRQSRMPSSA